MKKRIKINLKKLNHDNRLKNAKKWLQNTRLKDILKSYIRRYGIDSYYAYLELCELGYKEEMRIEEYEKDGIEWEYKYDGYKGEMYAVPMGTPDWELHMFW